MTLALGALIGASAVAQSPDVRITPDRGGAPDVTTHEESQPTPNPRAVVCTEASNHCQPAAVTTMTRPKNARHSTIGETVCADDFRPTAGGAVSHACWWGGYLALAAPADSFRIRYYGDAGGVPSGLLAEYSQAAGTLVVEARQDDGAKIGRVAEYEYTASHAPLSVSAGQCYWIEIANLPNPVQQWYWSEAAAVSGITNSRSLQDSSPLDSFHSTDAIAFDLAFCLNIQLATSSSCIPQACCLPGNGCGTCVDLSVQDCTAGGGTISGSACQASSCLLPGCGACCLGFGTCQSMSSQDCANVGGVFTSGSSCSALVCADAPAPCCFAIGFCTVLPQPDCVANGGTPAPGTPDCSHAACNDACAGALLLIGSTTVDANTAFATSSASDPAFTCHYAAPPPKKGVNTLWYKFVAEATAVRIVARSISGANADPVLALYDTTPGNACDSLVELACNDDDSLGLSLDARIDFDGLIPNRTYYIQVANAGRPVDFVAGDFELTLTQGVASDPPCCPGDANGDGTLDGRDVSAFVLALLNPPTAGTLEHCQVDTNRDGAVNTSDVVSFAMLLVASSRCPSDVCSNALPLSTSAYFDTRGAGTDGPPLPAACDEGNGISFDHDVWFCYTAPTSGSVVFSTCGTTLFDSRIAVYAGCSCPPTSLLACSDDDGFACSDFGAVLTMPVTAGQSYLVRVGGYGNAAGVGILTVSAGP